MKPNKWYAYLLLALLTTGCSQKIVTINVPQEIQQKIESAAPSQSYIFYLPNSENIHTYEDLQGFTVMVCSNGELLENASTLQNVLGSKVNVMPDLNLRSCVKSLEDSPHSILLTERAKRLPNRAKMVELEFK